MNHPLTGENVSAGDSGRVSVLQMPTLGDLENALWFLLPSELFAGHLGGSLS